MIHVTKAASDKLKTLREEGKALRVGVVGGGCSGLSYKMEWVDPASINDKDKLFVADVDLKIVIDGKSYIYLEGSMLDFSDGLNGKGFEWNNPNAERSCGCGSSFST
jgi:iron-sulfur cluster assembly protein